MKRREKQEYRYFELEEDKTSLDLQDAIINLYLSVKIRDHNDSLSLSDD